MSSAIVASFHPENPRFYVSFERGVSRKFQGINDWIFPRFFIGECNDKRAKSGCKTDKNQCEIEKLMLPISKQEKGCMSVKLEEENEFESD